MGNENNSDKDCPICYEEYEVETIGQYQCNQCKYKFCMKCYDSLKTEECPFCRYIFTAKNMNEKIYSHTYSSSSSLLLSQPLLLSEYSSSMDWNRSRIMRRQYRRQQRQRDYELQKFRNAEISRLHNHQIYNKKKNKERTDLLQFAME
jgi:hypothetical protein